MQNIYETTNFFINYFLSRTGVKENEKRGEMRGFATPKQGMRGKKQGMRVLQKKGASPVDALR